MAFITDSKSTQLGFLPLRSSGFSANRNLNLGFREFVGGVDVWDREQWPEGYGQFIFDPDSVGDLNGAQLWRVNQNPRHGQSSRDIPMWRFSTPVVIQAPEDEEAIPVPHCSLLQSNLFYRGWREIQGASTFPLPDERVEDFQYGNVSCSPEDQVDVWNQMPAGVIGVSLPTNEEDQQQNLFLPTDPRLITVSESDPSMSTIVCDVEGFEISTPLNGQPAGVDRLAPLSSLCRVVPSNLASPDCGLRGPFLALQAVLPPCPEAGETVFGGAGCWAFQDGPGRAYIGGMVSQDQWHGPFHPGHSVRDKHKIATDVDLNRINSMHISTDAYYYMNEDQDGPLKFDPTTYIKPQKGDVRYEVVLEFDKSLKHDHCSGEQDGKWRWTALVNTDSTSSSPAAPPSFISAVGTQDVPDASASLFRMPIVSDKEEPRDFLVSHNEKSYPAILARPQFINNDAPDLRNTITGKTPESMESSLYFTPVVGRLESIGLQYSSDAPEWSYKVLPGDQALGRYRTGSGDGGFVLLSADVGVEDHAFGTYSSTDDNAEASLIIAPDSSFLKFGPPDPTNSALISSGFGVDYASSSLRVRRWDGSSWSATMMMDSSGVTFNKAVILADAGVLTIAGGAVTATGSYHSIKD